ncbi:MAG: hypothetical protein P8J89_03020 [Phycisphaerales bacterium]|nr:hypothetical protein [Phycisphaerales bacterium]|tara:strand:- start:2574 stop:3536 length:963 start_codon:yes stop_codon:yes gene_type:complete
MSSPVRCLAWGIGSQQTLIKTASTVEGIDVVLAGSPTSDESREFAKAADAEQVDDLRAALLRDDWDVAWLIAPGCLDGDIRRVIRGLDKPVATSTPPADTVQIIASEDPAASNTHFLPLMRLGRPYRGAEQILESFGPVTSAHVEMIAGMDGVTSASLLYDAMDLVNGLFGMPDNLFAARAGEGMPPADATTPLNGHIVVSLRYPNCAAAAVSIAEGGGQWSRRIALLGEGGRLIVSDDGVEWLSADGEILDAGRGQTTDIPTAGEVAAHHLKRLAQQSEPQDEIDKTIATLCLCEAVRLSCITGQVEDPGRIAKMLQRV